MRRYWLGREALQSGDVRIAGDLLHHVRDVCRQHKGAKFELIDERGQAHLVEIIAEAKHESIARVLSSRQLPPLPRPHLHLALSVPRFPVFEAVLEKSVELGIKSIKPFFSDFSFIRSQAEVFARKRDRFAKIVLSATQQSGRGDVMTVTEPIGIDELLQIFNQSPASAGLFAYEGQGGLTAREGLLSIRAKSPEEVWLFAGSEGGFSEREVALFRTFGLNPMTLGQQVLRVETACVALASIIKYDFDLMR